MFIWSRIFCTIHNEEKQAIIPMKNNIYKKENIKKDLKWYKSLPQKWQQVEYATIYDKDGIKFLISVLPDPPAAPRFSHSSNAIYVTLAKSYFDIYQPLAITVYKNHLDSYTIHYAHTPFDKTKYHEHTSVITGHKHIEYKNIPNSHKQLFRKIEKIWETLGEKRIRSLIDNKLKHLKCYEYKTNEIKLDILDKFYFNSKIHWTYTWRDILDHKHVVDWDEKKKMYLYWWEHSTKKVYFKTLEKAFTYVKGDDLYDEYDNWLNCLKKVRLAQFISIQ